VFAQLELMMTELTLLAHLVIPTTVLLAVDHQPVVKFVLTEEIPHLIVFVMMELGITKELANHVPINVKPVLPPMSVLLVPETEKTQPFVIAQMELMIPVLLNAQNVVKLVPPVLKDLITVSFVLEILLEPQLVLNPSHKLNQPLLKMSQLDQLNQLPVMIIVKLVTLNTPIVWPVKTTEKTLPIVLVSLDSMNLGPIVSNVITNVSPVKEMMIAKLVKMLNTDWPQPVNVLMDIMNKLITTKNVENVTWTVPLVKLTHTTV
jgi:hypothetical protein